MREVKRNKPKFYTYYDEAAVEKALQRKSLPRHSIKRSNTILYAHVIAKLKLGWSPDAIAGRLKIDYPKDLSMRVSHEGIYRWVYKDFQDGGELYTHLAKTHKKRRTQRKYGSLRGLIKDRVSIRERPEIVEHRERIGDWEGDLVEGKKGTGFFVTHVDRASRFLISEQISTKHATSFNTATIKAFNSVSKESRMTITLDNGKEFSGFKEVEKVLGVKVYFADPYCSWQRGTNENTNALLRRYFPKGTDFSTITNRQLQAAVDTINQRPRKILNYQTPAEVYSR